MKTKLLFLLPMLAVIFAACEKNSKDEPRQERGMDNGHEWVDLGLSVKWATCNVGAFIPEEKGDYFAWGETSPKTTYATYEWSTYKWCNGSSTTMTKYCQEEYKGIVDNKTVLEPADDAAHVNWGGNWRMPTAAEQYELKNNCAWIRTTQNGVNGYLVTSKKNNNSIFLPEISENFSSGDYWSSSLAAKGSSSGAYQLNFGIGYVVCWIVTERSGGYPVRPVCQ